MEPLLRQRSLSSIAAWWRRVTDGRLLSNVGHFEVTGITCQAPGKTFKEVYPDAKVEEKHNDIEVTLPSLREDVEVAAFGIPGEEDQIRMQMAVFGTRPPRGSEWRIRIYLLHDTITAVKVIYFTKRYHNIIPRFLQLFLCKDFTIVAKTLRENTAGCIKTFTGKIPICPPLKSRVYMYVIWWRSSIR